MTSLTAASHALAQTIGFHLTTDFDHFSPAELLAHGNLNAAVSVRVDAEVMRYMLRRFEGNQVRTARALGINRNTLRKRMKAYGLTGLSFAPDEPSEADLAAADADGRAEQEMAARQAEREHDEHKWLERNEP